MLTKSTKYCLKLLPINKNKDKVSIRLRIRQLFVTFPASLCPKINSSFGLQQKSVYILTDSSRFFQMETFSVKIKILCFHHKATQSGNKI